MSDGYVSPRYRRLLYSENLIRKVLAKSLIYCQVVTERGSSGYDSSLKRDRDRTALLTLRRVLGLGYPPKSTEYVVFSTAYVRFS